MQAPPEDDLEFMHHVVVTLYKEKINSMPMLKNASTSSGTCHFHLDLEVELLFGQTSVPLLPVGYTS